MTARPFRDWWADRITVGWIVRRIWPSETVTLGPTYVYVIKNPILNLYAADPYRKRDSSNDPRRQWRQLRYAYTFLSFDDAEHCRMWQEIPGEIVRVKLS